MSKFSKQIVSQKLSLEMIMSLSWWHLDFISRVKFNVKKVEGPNITAAFQAKIWGKFAAVLLDADNTIGDTLNANFNPAIIETAHNSLGKQRPTKQHLIAHNILDLCVARIDLKKKTYNVEGAKKYRKVNDEIKSTIRRAKEDWIEEKC